MRQAFLSVAILLLAACKPHEVVQRHSVRPLMGTMVEVTVRGDSAERMDAAIDAAYLEMNRLSDLMNHYNPASIVSAINAGAGVASVAVPPELMDVLRMAQNVSKHTNGAFDITVGSIRGWSFHPEHPRMPSPADIAAQLPKVGYTKLQLDERARTAYLASIGTRIDLGGIAKLPILDAGLRTLRAHGIAVALLNGGGDIVASGGSPNRPWRVGIRDPDAPQQLRWTLELTDGYVSSSGDYERFFFKDGRRYHHILDPRSGYPARGPRAVTLVGNDLARINGLSCAIMVLGLSTGRDLIEQTPGLSGLIVDQDGSVWVSTPLQPRLTATHPG